MQSRLSTDIADNGWGVVGLPYVRWGLAPIYAVPPRCHEDDAIDVQGLHVEMRQTRLPIDPKLLLY